MSDADRRVRHLARVIAMTATTTDAGFGRILEAIRGRDDERDLLAAALFAIVRGDRYAIADALLPAATVVAEQHRNEIIQQGIL